MMRFTVMYLTQSTEYGTIVPLNQGRVVFLTYFIPALKLIRH